MAKFQFPWYRVIVFTLLIGVLAWWIHARDLELVEEEPVPAPRPGIGAPAGQSVPVVVLDILPHAIETIRGDVQDDGRPGATPTSGKVVEHDD